MNKVGKVIGPSQAMQMAQSLYLDALAVRRRTRDRAVAGKATAGEFQHIADLTRRAADNFMKAAAKVDEFAHISPEDQWVAYWHWQGERNANKIEALGGKAEVPPLRSVGYVENTEVDATFEALAQRVAETSQDPWK